MNNFKITESEWEIMKIVWESHPVTSQKIIDLLENKVEWTEPTIKTFINRLAKKEILGYKRSGRQYLYYPLVSQKDCIKEESKSFLNKVFNGAMGMMISNFLEDAHLSDQEIDNLTKLLEEKREKK